MRANVTLWSAVVEASIPTASAHASKQVPSSSNDASTVAAIFAGTLAFGREGTCSDWLTSLCGTGLAVNSSSSSSAMSAQPSVAVSNSSPQPVQAPVDDSSKRGIAALVLLARKR